MKDYTFKVTDSLRREWIREDIELMGTYLHVLEANNVTMDRNHRLNYHQTIDLLATRIQETCMKSLEEKEEELRHKYLNKE